MLPGNSRIVLCSYCLRVWFLDIPLLRSINHKDNRLVRSEPFWPTCCLLTFYKH
jgi:hypothetical protein